jgi:hypothetical protein
MLDGLLEYDGGLLLKDGGRLEYSGEGRKPSEIKYRSGSNDDVVSWEERPLGTEKGSSARLGYRGRSSDAECLGG